MYCRKEHIINDEGIVELNNLAATIRLQYSKYIVFQSLDFKAKSPKLTMYWVYVVMRGQVWTQWTAAENASPMLKCNDL